MVAATAVAAGGAAAVPASATLTGPGVDPGESISVFHNIDMVALAGYKLGTTLTVDVIRNGAVIGTVTAPAVATAEGNGLEINHGPEGPPAPGQCWAGHTPDIRPRDRIVVRSAGDTDEVTVDEIRFFQDNNPVEAGIAGPDGAPATDVGGGPDVDGDIVVRGVARFADGEPIPVDQLALSAEFRDGQFRGAPDVVERTGPAGSGQFTMRYFPPYQLERNRDSFGFDERKASLLGNGHSIGIGHIEPVPPEVQVADGIADNPGPAAGCEGVAPAAQDIVVRSQPRVLNKANVDSTTELLISGVSFNATTVTVTVPGLAAPLTATPEPAAIAGATPTRPGQQTWQVSVPMSQIAALADGNLRVTMTSERMLPDGTTITLDGGGKTVLKDVTAPGATPTAVPAGGAYNGDQEVTLNAGAHEIFYTVDGSEPSPTNGQRYTRPITIGTDVTLKSVAVDVAGNVGPVRTDTYTIDHPVAPDAPTIEDVRPRDGAVVVRWSAPEFTGNSPLRGYVVRAVSAGEPPHEMTVIGGARTRARITGLTNGVSYRIEVLATNGASFTSAPSARSSAVTPAARPGAPTLRSARPRRGAAVVRWRAPADDGGANVTRYRVRTWRGGTLVRSVRVGADRRRLRVRRLGNGVRYRFDVRARNRVGWGAASARSHRVRPRSVPSRPRIERARRGHRGSRRVTAHANWRPPRTSNGARIRAYRVQALRIRNGRVVAREWSRMLPRRARHVNMHLRRRAVYRFRVRAFNKVGRSRWSVRSNRVHAR